MEDGSTYFSVNRSEHWGRRGVARNLEDTDGMTVRKGEKYGILDTLQLETLEGIGEVSGFCVGPLGRLVLLSEDGDLWTYDRKSRHHERLFVTGHGLFGGTAQLAVTGDLLFVADASPDGVGEPTIAAYDMANGQMKWQRSGGMLDGVPFYPLAAASDDNYVYVLSPRAELEECEPDANGLVPLALIRLTLSGGMDAVFTDDRFAAYLPESSGDWRGIVFLAVSPDGGIHAFDSRGRVLFVFGLEGRLLTRMVLPPLSFAGLGVDSNRQMYLGDSRIIGEESEDDRFILHFGADGELIGRVAGFRGKTDGLLIDGSDRMYIWNAENRTITVLELQPQTLGWEGIGAPEGIWLSSAFDSAEAETVWHKFTLDADIPDGTQIRVSYFSSDSDKRVIGHSVRSVNEWISGKDISFDEKLAGLAPYWSEPVINPADALFFEAQGRYLWLKIEWIGSERTAPTLRRLRVYFPRDTLLSHLPSVYREESGSDFLERFLSLFGTLFDDMEEKIEGMALQFDRERVNGSQLRWLASWLGIACDEHWSDEWVRRLIRAAPELYHYRGTKRGIVTLIETLTGTPPIIVEPFQYKAMREHAELRWLTDHLYGDDPHTFTLLLHAGKADSDKERVLLKSLVEDHIPAYTEVRMMWLQPWMYLDLHTYLGVNTLLTEPSLFTIYADRNMPNDTLIVDTDMDRRMDAHTRLELDSELE
ncbi:phage tail protein [Cohnella faecalis]|uniref:phage tail protein n=1 Tax=Cohnella faecalis TaxID=2315694 RepID=UPI00361902A2